MVLTGEGPLVVHNCIPGLGFGMGPPKFKHTLKVGNGGVSVDMPLEECERVVGIYREKYPAIPALWKAADNALRNMINGYESTVGIGIKIRCLPDGVELPNGMIMRYPNLRWGEGEMFYDSRKGPVKIYGGKLVENIVQALARIVVFDQMAKFDQWLKSTGYGQIVLTVHDEIVACIRKEFTTLCVSKLNAVMSTVPRWATGLPIACETGAGPTYGNCK